MLYLYILGTVGLTVYGQIVLKWRIDRYGALPDAFTDKVAYFLQAVFDPFILSCFAAAFIAALFWMAAMTKADVSYALPIITASTTFFTACLAVFLLGEAMTVFRLIGILLIVSGVIVMHLTPNILS